MYTSIPCRPFWALTFILYSLTAVSCSSRTSHKATSVETKLLAPIPFDSQTPQPQRRWEYAYNQGVKLSNEGKPTEASYYFSNALGASPGNVTIIEAYCKTMLMLSKSERESEGIAYDPSILQLLEGFLHSQVPLVKFDDVETILSILADIREKMIASQSSVPEKRDEYETLLASITDDKYVLPESGTELAAALETLTDLKEYMAVQRQEDAAEGLSKKIDEMTARAQSALDFLTLSALLTSQKELVREACTISATIAEYKLQECEQTLRQMVALHATTHSAQVKRELDFLKDLSRAVAEAKGAENWKTTLSQLDSIKAERVTIKLSASNGLGVCQQKLDNLQQEASLLQNATPGLIGGSLETAVARMNALKEEALELNNEQSRAYNAWAMDQIEVCLTKGREGVGWFTNGTEGRREISRALINEMGPIDRRYLTTEVSRCFDEVLGKYLAPNQLNPVKSGNDLKEEGTILFTLNRMHEAKKKQVWNF